MPQAEIDLASKADKFVESASAIWKSFKAVKKAIGPFSQVSTALDLTNKAASGELPAYNAEIEKLRVFAAGQKDRLASLAQKDENYWIDLSGVNLFDRSTILTATAYFDEWIGRFFALS